MRVCVCRGHICVINRPLKRLSVLSCSFDASVKPRRRMHLCVRYSTTRAASRHKKWHKACPSPALRAACTRDDVFPEQQRYLPHQRHRRKTTQRSRVKSVCCSRVLQWRWSPADTRASVPHVRMLSQRWTAGVHCAVPPSKWFCASAISLPTCL